MTTDLSGMTDVTDRIMPYPARFNSIDEAARKVNEIEPFIKRDGAFYVNPEWQNATYEIRFFMES